REGDRRGRRLHPIRGGFAREPRVPGPEARTEAAGARGPGAALQPAAVPRRGLPAMNTARSHTVSWPIVLLGLALAGCGGGRQAAARENPAPPASSPVRPRVALVMKSLANEFFKTMADGAEKHQREHADAYELIVNGIKDERDLSRQVALVDEMIAQGVAA